MSQNSGWECEMAIGITNFEVSDPGFYDALISDQKKKTFKEPSSAANWVELGRLQDAKAQGQKQSFDDVQKKIETDLGANLWFVMSKEARSYLSTAEHAFSMLDKNSKETDFSLVGMERCKALETEINQKLVWPFIKKNNRMRRIVFKN